MEQNHGETETDYFKLKFDGRLSDYKAMIMVKLHVFANAFVITPKDLEKYWHDFMLPMPVNDTSFEKMYDEMRQHEWIKLQDETGKYLYGPLSETKIYMPSLMVNLCQQGLNRTLGNMAAYFRKGELTPEIRFIAESMYQELVMLNTWISIPLMNLFMDQGEMTLEEAQICKPYSKFYKDGVSFKGFVDTFQMYGSDKDLVLEGHDKTCILEAMLVACLFMRGICGFSSLCGFLNDATYPAKNFRKALHEIVSFIMVKFHNSYLYRMELAISPVNIDKAVEERGSQDHTTQMKIYLFDKYLTPYLIRIDMPHKGENDLHFNIRTSDDKSVEEDHSRIEGDIDGIEYALESIGEAMKYLCPNLIRWADSTREDDEKVLSDMKLLKVLDDVSADYLKGVENNEHLGAFSDMMGKKYENQAEAIFDAYQYFFKREFE